MQNTENDLDWMDQMDLNGETGKPQLGLTLSCLLFFLNWVIGFQVRFLSITFTFINIFA